MSDKATHTLPCPQILQKNYFSFCLSIYTCVYVALHVYVCVYASVCVYKCMHMCVCVRSQEAERLGNRASNRKVAGLIPSRAK